MNFVSPMMERSDFMGSARPTGSYLGEVAPSVTSVYDMGLRRIYGRNIFDVAVSHRAG
ncbi:MAG: hypothetical protein J6L73_00890 [Muribaculaceae bacterium]|nr:hypothetical protein [Muribaculaceae bacterium]